MNKKSCWKLDPQDRNWISYGTFHRKCLVHQMLITNSESTNVFLKSYLQFEKIIGLDFFLELHIFV